MMLMALAAGLLEVTIAGPAGPLAGTLTDPSAKAPAVILIPGSGPTDRDGNNPAGVSGAIYRQLADGLAERGVATLRIDKRGLFGSKAAITDPNAVTIADYAADVRGWAKLLTQRGKPCAWLAGHSEGGLVALAAAQDPRDICGLILLAAPGRPLGVALREQLKPKLPPEMFAATERAIAELEQGRKVDVATVPAPVAPLFNPAVQGFLIDMLGRDPAKFVAATRLPMLIIQGEADLQIGAADAKALAAAKPEARLVLLPGINHVWKAARSGDTAGNFATYGNAELRIDPAVADAVAGFVTARR